MVYVCVCVYTLVGCDTNLMFKRGTAIITLEFFFLLDWLPSQGQILKLVILIINRLMEDDFLLFRGVGISAVRIPTSAARCISY